MEKLKVESLLSAEIRVSNADTPDREHDINAVVRFDNGNVTNITQGTVCAKDDDKGMGTIASFDSFGAGTLSIQFHSKDSRESILAEVEAFIDKCRTDKELTTTAVNS